MHYGDRVSRTNPFAHLEHTPENFAFLQEYVTHLLETFTPAELLEESVRPQRRERESDVRVKSPSEPGHWEFLLFFGKEFQRIEREKRNKQRKKERDIQRFTDANRHDYPSSRTRRRGYMTPEAKEDMYGENHQMVGTYDPWDHGAL